MKLSKNIITLILYCPDSWNRKRLAIHVGQGDKGYNVVQVLEELRLLGGANPMKIQVDNGSEFISKEMDRCAYEQKVDLIFSTLGKPTHNPYTKPFNGSSRDEC